MTSKSFAVAIALSVGLLAGAPSAEACKCLPPTVAGSYASSTDVVRVQIVYGVTIGTNTWYLGRALSTFKGCIAPGGWIYIRTGSSSASCGLQLKSGVQYLINGSLDTASTLKIPVLTAGSCGYNRPISQLTKADRQFLVTRYNCCGKTCACVNGKAPVNCFADPCQVTDCPAGTCTANYCGGCNAEFFDDTGALVCQACTSNTDCAYGQLCSSQLGMCLPTCSSDAECNKGSWCRQTEAGYDASGTLIGQCTPYAEEGEHCGGFTAPWWVSQCAPGYVCTDYPEFIADAPGTCRLSCEKSSQCPDSQYCDTSGVCRDDGACKTLKDCGAEGNSYMTLDCMGYDLCQDGKCGTVCGNPTCPNLAGINFGFCAMVLGVANIDGNCQTVSGCSDQGYTLFADLKACNAACNVTTQTP
jgi:hypothetical protein